VRILSGISAEVVLATNRLRDLYDGQTVKDSEPRRGGPVAGRGQ